LKDKIALFCNVRSENVIEAIDVSTIYEVPLRFAEQEFDLKISKRLQLKTQNSTYQELRSIVEKIKKPTHKVRIAICGKYIQLKDAYKSIAESFTHAGVVNDCKIQLKWVDSEKVEEEGPEYYFEDVAGLLIPGGFGDRGIEGKLKAIQYARENNIPFFGICLGLQCAVIEFARHVCALNLAHSSEFDPGTPYPVIDIMEEQKNIKQMGGTMRLGAYDCVIKKESKAYQAYHTTSISERHRHRYEINNQYRNILQQHGMVLSGINPERDLVEIIELKDHPHFLGCQFHPELKSRIMKPHPLFVSFVKAAIENSRT
jgi:CTP synthase